VRVVSQSEGTTDPDDPFPGLLRIGPLRTWFDEVDLGSGADLHFERIAMGESNEVFVAHRGDERWVLRRPAAVPLSVDGANRIMEREFRFQRALAGTDVPHAEPLALCTDTGVTGAVFYVMEFVDGLIAHELIPEDLGGPAASQRIAEEMLDALGALAAVDHEEAGIADLGHPEGFLERQVDRWRGQLESYQQRELPGVDEVTDWLAANRPSTTVPGVMHGDYNRHNMLFSRLVGHDAPTRLLAVLDWENATVGDPLMDLGYLLAGWSDDDPDLPTRVEAVTRWSERSGRQPVALGWYATMTTFKLACMLEGVYVRQSEDPTREASEFIAQLVLDLIARARRLAAEGADW
jgi:aminoglycoside phosphotransferase (APT) family kinase protein